MNHNILLSICIPTYNRSNYLKHSLDSIVCLEEFYLGSKVEIIISDNNSDDQTEELVKSYISLYGDKIKYFKNKENISDLNFEKALTYGNGVYLKLSNDTLIYSENSLNDMLLLIEKYKVDEPLLFFINEYNEKYIERKIFGIDRLVSICSYKIGWIGSFGVWRGKLNSLPNFSRRSDLKLLQIDVLFRLCSTSNPAILYYVKLFEPQNVKKGGYDLLEVFLVNYSFLLNEQCQFGTLSLKTYKSEKRKILFGFIMQLVVLIKLSDDNIGFKLKNLKKQIRKFCIDIPNSFYLFYFLFIFKFTKHYIKRKLN